MVFKMTDKITGNITALKELANWDPNKMSILNEWDILMYIFLKYNFGNHNRTSPEFVLTNDDPIHLWIHMGPGAHFTFTLISTWISDWTHYNGWDEIAYPFPTFGNGWKFHSTLYWACDNVSTPRFKLNHVRGTPGLDVLRSSWLVSIAHNCPHYVFTMLMTHQSKRERDCWIV